MLQIGIKPVCGKEGGVGEGGGRVNLRWRLREGVEFYISLISPAQTLLLRRVVRPHVLPGAQAGPRFNPRFGGGGWIKEISHCRIFLFRSATLSSLI